MYSPIKIKNEDNNFNNQINQSYNNIFYNNQGLIYNNNNQNFFSFPQFLNTNKNFNSKDLFVKSFSDTINSNDNINYSQNLSENINKNNLFQNNSFTSNSCPNLFSLYNNNNENCSSEFIQLQKGFKDVENLYKQSYHNTLKDNRNISLQCNYYCNLKPNFFIEESYEEYDRDH